MDPNRRSDIDLVRLFEMFRAGMNGKSQLYLFAGLIIIAAIWLITTTAFQVEVDEVAVIQRFGKYVRQSSPGLRFKFPSPIETKTNVKVNKVYTMEFGLRTQKADVKTSYAPAELYLSESLMLTGDLNCGVISWIVQYRINDAVSYLFKVSDVEGTLRDISEASMRLIVGDRSIDEVISKRLEIADEMKIVLQKTLDEAHTGLTVVNVELKNTTVPAAVQPSFNEVNQAEQEREKMINEARGDYNRIIPAAHGQADELISRAEGYALDRINRAQGDSARFVSLYSAYADAKDVTRRRMYLETMMEVLPKLGNKYIMDSDQKGVLPLFNMGTIGGKN